MSKFSHLLPKETKHQKFENQLKFYNSILGVISKSFSWKRQVSFGMCCIFQDYPFFANFTIEMIGSETGLPLKFVDLGRKLINKS